MNKRELYKLIRLSLWGNVSAVAGQDVFEEMKHHAIATLAAPCLSSLDLPSQIETEWKKDIIQQVSYYTYYCLEQKKLPITVPYVVLKGTSAAKYYPYPEYRMMGDIDIMTHHEDFDTACKQLVDNGYQIVAEIYKETELVKNCIHVFNRI